MYLRTHDPVTMAKIVAFLSRQDYVGGILVDDDYGMIPGALPISAIRLAGSSKVPRPSIVIACKSFATNAYAPVMHTVRTAKYSLQHGQEQHGSFGRTKTFNIKAAS